MAVEVVKKDKQALLAALESISTIPTLPAVVEKITRLLQNPQTSAEEVGRAITTDQAIAAKVLKLVNSAFYGFPGKIGTVTHAIVILGFNTVKNIVLTASVFDFFQKRGNLHPDFSMEKFWAHSIACGAASQAVARYAGFSGKEECFIGGLIHDIGKVVLCQFMQEQFGAIIDASRENDSTFYEAERAVLGIAHPEIGGILVERWNLPKNLQSVVKFHHVPSTVTQDRSICSVVHVADILVRALDFGHGGDDKIPMMDPAVWKELRLGDVSLPALLEDVSAEVEKALALIHLM